MTFNISARKIDKLLLVTDLVYNIKFHYLLYFLLIEV